MKTLARKGNREDPDRDVGPAVFSPDRASEITALRPRNSANIVSYGVGKDSNPT